MNGYKNREYLVKLTNGVYKVTDGFPENEPLKFKLREIAGDILADLISFQSSVQKTQKEELQAEIFNKIEILAAYFDLAESQNWVDSKNFLLLRQEYGKIKKELLEDLEINQEPSRSFAKLRLGSENQNLSERQKKILQILKKREKAQVGELQKIFSDVSKRTLRRDLDDLLNQGMVDRVGQWNEIYYKVRTEVMS